MTQSLHPFSFIDQAMSFWSQSASHMIDATVQMGQAMTGAQAAQPDAPKSWYRQPAPATSRSPAWATNEIAAAAAFNPFAMWAQAFAPQQVSPGAAWAYPGSPVQAMLAGPFTKACNTFWTELMREGFAASTSPAAMTALASDPLVNPFAAYRSAGGHASAQTSVVPPSAINMFAMYNPAWMMAAFASAPSRRLH